MESSIFEDLESIRIILKSIELKIKHNDSTVALSKGAVSDHNIEGIVNELLLKNTYPLYAFSSDTLIVTNHSTIGEYEARVSKEEFFDAVIFFMEQFDLNGIYRIIAKEHTYIGVYKMKIIRKFLEDCRVFKKKIRGKYFGGDRMTFQKNCKNLWEVLKSHASKKNV